MKVLRIVLLLTALSACACVRAQSSSSIDSIRYRITYRDTIVYRYDTVYVKRYIYTDTLMTTGSALNSSESKKRKGFYNPTSWGIGPSIGAYYSPYHGFDINLGFGIQYYLWAVPSFRNPHMGHRKKHK